MASVETPEVETTKKEKSMDALLDEWDDDVSESSLAEGRDEYKFDDSDDEDDHLRDVYADDNALDHIVLATNNLDSALELFEEMTGSRPVMVVSHNGLGTKSARISFDECSFLEIIGPDPKQTGMPLAQELSALEDGKLVPFHYAVRNNNSTELKLKEWPAMGLEPDHITMYAKDKKGLWKWDMVFFGGHSEAGLVPFFMQWGDSPHACSKLPVMGRLTEVLVRAPSDSKAHELLAGVSDISVEQGEPLLQFTFTSEKGTHTFSTSEPIGISFPEDPTEAESSSEDDDEVSEAADE